MLFLVHGTGWNFSFVQYSGYGMVAAGQLAKRLSVVMVFVLILRMFSVCGLNPTEGILIACVQAVCLLVFAARRFLPL